MVDFDSLGDHGTASDEPPDEPNKPKPEPRNAKKELALQTMRRFTKKPAVPPAPKK